ncbi:unnamed protein product, partial [Acanthoscelides obtectus]
SDVDPGYVPNGSSEDYSSSDSKKETFYKPPNKIARLYESSSEHDQNDAGPSCSFHTAVQDQMANVPSQVLGSELETSGNHPEEDKDSESVGNPEIIETHDGPSLRDLSQSVWRPVQGNNIVFPETVSSGMNVEWQVALEGEKPVPYFFP